MEWPLLTVALNQPEDIVVARHRARQIAALAGLDAPSQTRLAASVSEISRNAIIYAGGGRVAFAISRGSPAALCVRVSDSGPGISDLDAVLEGRSTGLGVTSARRLVDDFTVSSGPAGTTVTLGRRLPDGAVISATDIGRIIGDLGSGLAPSPVAELQTQNTELVTSLSELRIRQDELVRLNTELEDTNRGVVALYAELDERAEQLRQASELKSRFLSNMSHEFRTPLNSILALSRLLMDRVDGPLTAEQERQVSYIRRSAESLTELVNDLLDLAKVEAGKLEIRPGYFTISELFGALRGVMKPLQQNDAVDLIFEEPADCPALFTDEAKVAQILRNLISNALKFTERGEVRVSAVFDGDTRQCRLEVADTGIGIAPEDHDLVFQEFSQVANTLQHRAKGTGLGLPLSRRLAELLGGTLNLRSTPAIGSAFTLCIPSSQGQISPIAPDVVSQPNQPRGVLVIDDEETSRYVLRQMLAGCGPLRVQEAETGADGLRLARAWRPDVVLLDIRLPDIDGFDVMDRLCADPTTVDVPVIICTSSVLTAQQRNRLSHARAILSKATLTRDVMQRALSDVWLMGLAFAMREPSG
ncbi:MAG TPA: ATP-binding protein [Rhodopila sp.]|jgi:signal transduction histidine kinase/CheY-like chemotaxis protein|nr:ATP-binding protein [Rhodopila sp.]